MAQVEREQKPQMREVVLNSFVAFMKAENFVAKRQFVKAGPVELNGLVWLSDMLCLTGDLARQRYGQGA